MEWAGRQESFGRLGSWGGNLGILDRGTGPGKLGNWEMGVWIWELGIGANFVGLEAGFEGRHWHHPIDYFDTLATYYSLLLLWLEKIHIRL